tara:strand:- start:401 stop:1135 length:735 start_codon:yes stop_codon:yes gene_type:complete
LAADGAAKGTMQLLDLSLFEQMEGGADCGGEHGAECQAADRVVAALDYYQFLFFAASAPSLVAEPEAAFAAFCEEMYSKRHLRNDYIHWVLHHRDPESVQLTRSRLQFTCDSAKHCGATTRHYRDRRGDDNGADDAPSNWFTEKMDCIHFNVYHLNELGLRVSAETMESELAPNDEKQDESHLVDLALQRMTEIIESKRALFSTERLDGATNSKFTLQIDEQKESGHGVGGDGLWSLYLLSTWC